MSDGATTKKQGDLFSLRSQRLQMLARVKFENYPWKTRSVSGHALKVVLQRIDNCIGKDDSWCISIARLAKESGLNKATVSVAVAVLSDLHVIDVSDRRQGMNQLPSEFRIVWSNVPDFIPTEEPVMDTARQPEIVTQSRSAVTHRTERRPPPHRAATPTAPCGDPHRTMRRPPPHHAVQPDQSPVQPQPTPPPAFGQGASMKTSQGSGDQPWQTFTDDDLRDAVRDLSKGNPNDLIETLFTEAAEMKWLPDDGVVRVEFYSACHHLVTGTRAGTGKRILSLRAALIARCKRFNKKRSLMGNQESDEWARAAAREWERFNGKRAPLESSKSTKQLVNH